MSALWTPESARRRDPKVSREHEQGTRQWEHLVLSMMHATGGVLDHWNPELRKIDPQLRLMQAMPGAVAPGVVAGYYHLVRLRDPARSTFMWVQPLMGPNGEFVEPTSGMLEGLRASDLQNARAVYDRHRQDEQAAKSAERSKLRDDEDRIDEGVERLNAATRTQILVSPDVRWSQNNSSAARRDRGERGK